MKELGIYVHIPFCKKKCDYCDFVSFSNKEEKIEEYIKTLLKEIEEESNKISRQIYKVTTIYFGGGTPSYIDPKYIEMVLDLIKEKFNLYSPEITLEVNPGTIDEEKLKYYYKMGINRLSIGLQSTKNELLQLIGRIHSFEEFLNTFEMARKVGFKNINVDLMIGLPSQTINDVRMSVDEIIKLNPEHISVYSLILEEGTVLEEKIKNNELELPNEEVERRMYWTVKQKLEESEFNQYEISNFSKKGYESKHNLNCWNQEEYVGFGLASHSYINNKRYSNTTNLYEYLKNYSDSKTVNEEQDEESKKKEYMMIGLRKTEGVLISKFEQKFGINPLFYFRFEISKLVDEELIEIDLDNIKLTRKGLDLANQVFQEFV